MAYHSRSRDPLLDSNMQAAIERRGKELIGILLICLGLAAAAMIGSYTPDDPNWMVSTDAPVQNWMGRIGASLAAPLFMIVGWGSWGVALVPIMWGLRFALHWGEDRALGRLIFAPIAIALASIYAATLVPGDVWRATHSFGLGGLFGDTVMGVLLTVLPIGSHLALKLLSGLAAICMVGLSAYAFGFSRAEIGRGLKMSVIGVVMCYAALMTFLGRGASSAVAAARAQKEQIAERRAEARLAREDGALGDDVVYEDTAVSSPESFGAADGFEPETEDKKMVRRGTPDQSGRMRGRTARRGAVRRSGAPSAGTASVPGRRRSAR